MLEPGNDPGVVNAKGRVRLRPAVVAQMRRVLDSWLSAVPFAGPTRTITLVFTDIEGSTRLLRDASEEYAALLAEHRSVVREAFGLNNGREIGTQGDAVFGAFESARDAVRAAVETQRTLVAPEWPFEQQIRVRIGIDTGEAIVDDEYIGLVVHRAARICAAAHGGQVLLSAATRSVLGEDEPAGTALRDLGNQSLKDFDQGEHLFQLLIDGLPADLRSPRTGDDGAAVGLHSEDDIARAVEATVALRESPQGVAATGAAEPIARLRRAISKSFRSLGTLIAITLAILGAIYTPWLYVAAIGVWIITVVAKAALLRREAVYTVGSQVFALEVIAPDQELAKLLHDLGTRLMIANEWVLRVDGYLSENNPTTIARELRRRRATASSSVEASQIDSLGREVDALVELRDRRTVLLNEVSSFEKRTNEIRDALFEIRLGRSQREELAAQLGSDCRDVAALVTGLRQQLAMAKRCDTTGINGPRRRPLSARLSRRFWRHGLSWGRSG